MRLIILFLALLLVQRHGKEPVVTQRAYWVWGGTRNTQAIVHVLVPTIGILNQFIVEERYKSGIINYSSIPAKSDRAASGAMLSLYFTISNCRTAFFVAVIIKTIEVQCVLSLARDQEMEE